MPVFYISGPTGVGKTTAILTTMLMLNRHWYRGPYSRFISHLVYLPEQILPPPPSCTSISAWVRYLVEAKLARNMILCSKHLQERIVMCDRGPADPLALALLFGFDAPQIERHLKARHLAPGYYIYLDAPAEVVYRRFQDRYDQWRPYLFAGDEREACVRIDRFRQCLARACLLLGFSLEVICTDGQAPEETANALLELVVRKVAEPAMRARPSGRPALSRCEPSRH